MSDRAESSAPPRSVSIRCRDCLTHLGADIPIDAAPDRCPACGSPRLTAHADLETLSLAHIDCDAFYASVEKRDDPSLTDKPVIVGGGTRGVVATCCYVARLYGVRSAMPMFKALTLCPDAVVIRPNMEKYSAVGRQVRALMLEMTPLVEPISIDEAFLDLTGTQAIHGCAPAGTLMRLAYRIEQEIGVTVSVGLSYNKFLAKIASDLQKPRGFAVIGRSEAQDFLAPKSVDLIWGVGTSLKKRLNRDGIQTIADLRAFDALVLVKRYGSIGQRLHAFARGDDGRSVTPERETKSVSAETTLSVDIAEVKSLLEVLWPLCEKVARRMAKAGLVGRTAVLKLKDTDFVSLTRSKRLAGPTDSAEMLYRAVEPVLRKEVASDPDRAFRLVGVGLGDVEEKRPGPADLLDIADTAADRDTRARPSPEAQIRRTDAALAAVQGRLGFDAIARGRGKARPK